MLFNAKLNAATWKFSQKHNFCVDSTCWLSMVAVSRRKMENVCKIYKMFMVKTL